MRRLRRWFGTPYGLGVLGCLMLAGWAAWSGGLLDGPVARQVRASSVYAAPGAGVDRAAAQRIIGNRRLAVLLLAPGGDVRARCDDAQRATKGLVVVALSPGGDGFDTYGCSRLPGGDDENFGKSYVTEARITDGIDEFPDRPLEAVKVIVVNYDLLVRAGIVPDGARTVSPSLPRYLVAVAAVAAVLAGAAGVWAAGRRAARLA
ncbi:hypothetical protein, partial [Mangrovihabitans endophyticus]|uniref:hypothetical protein n=1 Tax=Mangrovihabitans endophyticus TaxID=1751298 RepID=UPI001665935D